MTINGPAAQGKSGILGTSINPINVYMQYQRQREQQNYLREQEVKKRRDETFDRVEKYNPDAGWEPFMAEVNNMAYNEVRVWAQHELNSGKDPNQIQAELAYRQGAVNNFAKETLSWKDTHDKALTTIKGDAKYNPEAVTALRDVFLQPNGRPQPKEYIRHNLSAVDQIMYNPDYFNPAVVTKKFMDTLPEQTKQTWGTLQKEDGTYLTSKEMTAKLPYLRDASGNPQIDPHTQQPIPIVNENLYTLAMGSQDMRLLMQKFGGDTRAGQEAWLKKVLPGQDKVSYKEDIKGGFKKTEGERTAGDTLTMGNERFKNTELLVNHFRPDLLAAVFDPSQPNRAEYITDQGKPVTGYDEVTKTYFTGDGKSTTKEPTKIRVTIKHGGLAGDFIAMGLKSDFAHGIITKDQLDEKLKVLTESAGKEDTRIFDRTTKEGKRVLHQIISRMQDEFLPPKERLGESYSKIISEHYDEGNTGGVYTK